MWKFREGTWAIPYFSDGMVLITCGKSLLTKGEVKDVRKLDVESENLTKGKDLVII